ncbi:luciferin sulfotransferase isoform X1 [Nilaparvata lugens]|uniref:luciferin sulfotransferase isoform X1 n=1 Tax=Nilaparvata lugens TaxID=108931 RepID=UPI000B992427|nr:luciferin sulfotransferase isoform X1 [Nilaparvata lugens]
MPEYEIVDGEDGQLLKEKFTTCFRTGYVRIKGCVLPEHYLKFTDQIRDMKVRDEDIWVCSFPKTGTTWTQEMVWCIANDLDFEGAKVNLPQRFPFLDHTPLFDYGDLFDRIPEMRNLPEYVTDSVGHIDRLPSVRHIKTHLPFQLLPQQLQERTTKAKIVYVARNPKDTCLSYFHHCVLMEGYTGKFEEFAELFLNNSLCFAPYASNILGFWERRNDPNILFIRFEDLKKDLPSVIRKTAKFLNKDLSDEQVSRLSEHLSFESMKNNRAVNYEEVVEINKKFKLIEADGCFMRSGKVGEWKAKMSPQLIDRFDKWTEKYFANSGLTF